MYSAYCNYSTPKVHSHTSIFYVVQSLHYLQTILYSKPVMGTHWFIRYFVTVTVTSLVTAVTNEFLF
jgi:hypothetical protein